MTSAGTLARALAGEAVSAFVPMVWRDLPGFVHSQASPQWWRDVGFCQRALSDAAGVCQADGMLVPIVGDEAREALRSSPGEPTDVASDITESPAVQPSLTLVAQAAATAGYDVVALMPTLEEMADALPGCERDDIEDAVSDLAREALNRGAIAVAVRALDPGAATEVTERLATVATYFGARSLAVTPDRAWAHGGEVDVHVVSAEGPWPASVRGIVTTYVDLSSTTPAAVRSLVQTRRGASGFDER
jgi:hypothetical protein